MTFFDKKYLPYITLFIIVFLSRLPFLFAGYGAEEDSWGIVLAVHNTKFLEFYEPSRLPGHPVQELIYLLFHKTGPFIFNGLSAFFSAIGAVFFALILKHFHFRHYFIASLAFAFIPVYYISSTYTIDFVWTEAFVLAAFYFLLKGRLIISGIFLGLAIGCRITSGAMLLPFLIIIWQKDRLKQTAIQILKISVPMIIVATVAFIPIIQRFGFSFFMYYDQFPYPPLTKVFYKMIPGVFGFIGTMAILVSILLIIVNRKKLNPGNLFQQKLDDKIIFACFIIIILYTISYFRLPQKSGYMIPVIPFVLLLFGYYLDSKSFKSLCIALIISPFVCSVNLTDKLRGATYSDFSFKYTVSGQEIFFDLFSGPVFSDYSKRKQKMKYTNEVIEKVKTISKRTVIIAGWWYNEIMVKMLQQKKNTLVIYEPYIDQDRMNKYLERGYEIVYLAEQNIYNDQMFKMNITNSVSKELE